MITTEDLIPETDAAWLPQGLKLVVILSYILKSGYLSRYLIYVQMDTLACFCGHYSIFINFLKEDRSLHYLHGFSRGLRGEMSELHKQCTV